MIPPRQAPPAGWAPARFWTVAVALFILQGGLIWCFAERQHKIVIVDQPLLRHPALVYVCRTYLQHLVPFDYLQAVCFGNRLQRPS